MKLRQINLVTKFAVFSFLILVALGLFLNFFISGYIEERIFSNFANIAVPSQNRLITPELKASDFRGKKTLDTAEFNRFIRHKVFSRDIVFIKIWRRDGMVMWTNRKGGIGKKFTPKRELREALHGKVKFERTDLSDVENVLERPKQGELLEIYSPIWLRGHIVGAYEVYYSLDPVIEDIDKIRRFIAMALGGGLFVLYLAQFAVVKSASDTISGQNRDLRTLSDELASSYEQLKAHYLGTLISLDHALDARDKVTGAHSSRLKNIAHKIGSGLALGPEAHRRIEYSSQLHDIGKIGTPEAVLQKPGPLDAGEMAEMRNHARLGAEIIRSVPFLVDTANIVEHHHERFDGGGYPDGLAGDDIPIEARILSVVDAFDAMTHDRPYRAALPVETAVKELIEGKGKQFDPQVVDLFLQYLAEDEGVALPPEGEDELRSA